MQSVRNEATLSLNELARPELEADFTVESGRSIPNAECNVPRVTFAKVKKLLKGNEQLDAHVRRSAVSGLRKPELQPVVPVRHNAKAEQVGIYLISALVGLGYNIIFLTFMNLFRAFDPRVVGWDGGWTSRHQVAHEFISKSRPPPDTP